MSKQIGTIIDTVDGGPDGGIPTIELDPNRSNGDKRETDRDGSDTPRFDGFESPETVRIEPPTGKGKRGRRKGAGNRSTASFTPGKETPSDSLIDLSLLLMSLHQMGAAIVGIEELKLDESEADAMADAIKTLSKHYPTHINPKALAWLNFGAVAIGIYGTRFEAYRMRMKKERETKPRIVPIKPQQSKANGAPHVPTAATDNPASTPGSSLTPSQIWYEPASEDF